MTEGGATLLRPVDISGRKHTASKGWRYWLLWTTTPTQTLPLDGPIEGEGYRPDAPVVPRRGSSPGGFDAQ